MSENFDEEFDEQIEPSIVDMTSKIDLTEFRASFKPKTRDYSEIEKTESSLNDLPELKKLEEEYKVLMKYQSHSSILECLNKILEAQPKAKAKWLGRKGNVLDKLGEYEKAIECYSDILGLDPLSVNDMVWTLINMGSSFYMLDEYEKAIECYDDALKNDSKNVSGLFNKGLVLDKLGKYEEMNECYDTVIRIDETNAEALAMKGWALGRSEKWKESIEYYDRSLKVDSENPIALNNKAWALFKLGIKLEEALVLSDKSLKVEPKAPNFWDTKGHILKKLGRNDEAEECFKMYNQLESKPSDWDKGPSLI